MKAVIGIVFVVSVIVVGCYSTAPLHVPTVIEQSGNAGQSQAEIEHVIIQPPIITKMPAPAPAPMPEQQHTMRAPASISEPHIVDRTERSRPLLVPPRAQQRTQQQTTEDWMSKLRQANIVLTIPERANINEDVRVELLLHLEKEIAEIAKLASERGTQYGNTISVSRITDVKLTAPSFEVDAITPSRQVLKDKDINTWKWTLRPKSSGKHTIDITVLAVVEAEGVRVENTLVTFARQVQIEITPQQLLSQWFAKYWQWLASTIVIPLLLWWYKSRKRDTVST